MGWNSNVFVLGEADGGLYRPDCGRHTIGLGPVGACRGLGVGTCWKCTCCRPLAAVTAGDCVQGSRKARVANVIKLPLLAQTSAFGLLEDTSFNGVHEVHYTMHERLFQVDAKLACC